MEPKMSPKIVAWLGNATRQAVHQSGDPGKWLQARLRRELFTPGTKGHGWKKQMKPRLIAILGRAKQASVYISPTRPIKNGRPEDLAVLLGVGDQVGKDPTYMSVVHAFIMKMMPRVKEARTYREAVRKLDAVVVRWVNRGLHIPKGFLPYMGNGWRPLDLFT